MHCYIRQSMPHLDCRSDLGTHTRQSGRRSWSYSGHKGHKIFCSCPGRTTPWSEGSRSLADMFHSQVCCPRTGSLSRSFGWRLVHWGRQHLWKLPPASGIHTLVSRSTHLGEEGNTAGVWKLKMLQSEWDTQKGWEKGKKKQEREIILKYAEG